MKQVFNFIIIVIILLVASCSANADTQEPQVKSVQRGKASWYAVSCNHGTTTASGIKLRNNAPTAAHKTLPLGTSVRVTNEVNGLSEIVTITDRGPYIKGRIIDLTVGAAKRLGFLKAGVTQVKVEVLAHYSSE